jgi:hypothetical protein
MTQDHGKSECKIVAAVVERAARESSRNEQDGDRLARDDQRSCRADHESEGEEGMKRAVLISLWIVITTVLTHAWPISSIEIGVEYRFADEGIESPFLTPRWESIAFLADGRYRVTGETLLYEGSIETEPTEDGFSLRPELRGTVSRVWIPGAGGIIFREGGQLDSLAVAGFSEYAGVVALASEWTDLMPRSGPGLSLSTWQWIDAALERVN